MNETEQKKECSTCENYIVYPVIKDTGLCVFHKDLQGNCSVCDSDNVCEHWKDRRNENQKTKESNFGS